REVVRMSAAPKRNSDLVGRTVAFGLVGIVLMLILPIPAVLLDVMLAVSVTIGLLIFLMAVNINEPLQLSSFPSVLLVATMFRLSLNLASTHLILLRRREEKKAGGAAVHAFGNVVVGS